MSYTPALSMRKVFPSLHLGHIGPTDSAELVPLVVAPQAHLFSVLLTSAVYLLTPPPPFPQEPHRPPQWGRTAKNRDVSTGLLTRPFARSLAPLTQSLALHCSLRLRTPLRSFVHPFA